MKKLVCLAVLCFGFVGCSAEAPKKVDAPAVTPSAAETTPAAEPAKDAPETPKDPAAPAAEPK